MIYAVIDTNVIVSALLSHTHNSSTVKIMEAIFNGMICPLYNSEIINEYADVLTRPKFSIPSHSVGEIINLIEKLGIESDRVHTDEIIKDLDDVVFYEVTLSKEGALLVTGNIKHFPRNSIVVTPAEMIRILEINCTK